MKKPVIGDYEDLWRPVPLGRHFTKREFEESVRNLLNHFMFCHIDERTTEIIKGCLNQWILDNIQVGNLPSVFDELEFRAYITGISRDTLDIELVERRKDESREQQN